MYIENRRDKYSENIQILSGKLLLYEYKNGKMKKNNY